MAQDYITKSGDCIDSIAYSHGFFWKTLWDHSKNSKLKSLREDPNILFEGDIVHVPDLREKQESGSTESRHRYKVKGVPAKLRLQFFGPPKPKSSGSSESKKAVIDSGGDGGVFGKVVGAVKDVLGMASGSTSQSVFEDPDPEPASPIAREPRKNVDYVANIDGILMTGKTDSRGIVELSISPKAREGSITLAPGTPDETVCPLKLGYLAPISEDSGAIQRLAHLGYRCEGEGSEQDRLSHAITVFQGDHGLPVTGKLDSPTRNKIKERHGS